MTVSAAAEAGATADGSAEPSRAAASDACAPPPTPAASSEPGAAAAAAGAAAADASARAEDEEADAEPSAATPEEEAARLKRTAANKKKREKAKEKARAQQADAGAAAAGAQQPDAGGAGAGAKSGPGAKGARRSLRGVSLSLPPHVAAPSLALPASSSSALPVQTDPPSIPIAAFFPSGVFPEGELQEYRDECGMWEWPPSDAPAAAGSPPHAPRSNAYRTTSAECRERARALGLTLNDARKAAEARVCGLEATASRCVPASPARRSPLRPPPRAQVHRAVRKYIRTVAVPGVRLIDMCETLEGCVRKLIEENGLQARARARGRLPPHARARVGTPAALYRVTGAPVDGDAQRSAPRTETPRGRTVCQPREAPPAPARSTPAPHHARRPRRAAPEPARAPFPRPPPPPRCAPRPGSRSPPAARSTTWPRTTRPTRATARCWARTT